MFGGYEDRLRKMFADQFEPDGDNFVYRKYTSGAPIPVSATEHEKYITAFNNFLKYGFWGVMGGMTVLALLIIAYAIQTDTDVSGTAIYVGVGAITAVYLSGYFWAWNLPARELRGRATVGEARSRAEIKQRMLARIGYGEVVALGVLAVVAALKVDRNDLFSQQNALWLTLAIVAAVISTIMAFRKWRFDSERK